MAKEQAKRREKKNMLRLSPFEIEYEDMQKKKKKHAIAPTVQKKKKERDKAKDARKQSLDEVSGMLAYT